MDELKISLNLLKVLKEACKGSPCSECEKHELCSALYVVASEMYEYMPYRWDLEQIQWGINRANEVLNNG